MYNKCTSVSGSRTCCPSSNLGSHSRIVGAQARAYKEAQHLFAVNSKFQSFQIGADFLQVRT